MSYQRKHKRQWVKVASVTYHEQGKPYFWYSANPSPLWIVFSRSLRRWTVQDSQQVIIRKAFLIRAKQK